MKKRGLLLTLIVGIALLSLSASLFAGLACPTGTCDGTVTKDEKLVSIHREWVPCDKVEGEYDACTISTYAVEWECNTCSWSDISYKETRTVVCNH